MSSKQQQLDRDLRGLFLAEEILKVKNVSALPDFCADSVKSLSGIFASMPVALDIVDDPDELAAIQGKVRSFKFSFFKFIYFFHFLYINICFLNINNQLDATIMVY